LIKNTCASKSSPAPCPRIDPVFLPTWQGEEPKKAELSTGQIALLGTQADGVLASLWKLSAKVVRRVRIENGITAYQKKKTAQ
jgi:hypothetical protein